MARTSALSVFTLMLVFPVAMSRLFATANAASLSPAGSHERDPGGQEVFKGKKSFPEAWTFDAAASTCTCTCYPSASSKTPPARRSPVDWKKSPPPPPQAPYGPSPGMDAPTSKSPTAPPPPKTPIDEVPSYEQPAPTVETSPQTFVPSPPPPQAY